MKTFHTITSFISRQRERAYVDPVRDWLVVLTVSIFVFIGLVVWNVWAFDTVVRGGTIGTVATSTPATINQSSLHEVYTIFEKRAEEKARYVTGVYRYTDPSQ